MTTRHRLGARLPLAVWLGGGVGALTALAVGALLAFLRWAGSLDATTGTVIVWSCAVAIVPAMLSSFAGVRLTAQLRTITSEAPRLLGNVVDAVESTRQSRGGWEIGELAELAQGIDALHVRVRLADELADRHRRMSETASAGMFELLSGLVAAEEGTRGQLSAELHDTAAQSLMLARTRLAEVIEDPTIELPEQVLQATEYVSEAEDQVRAVMARTRPPALRDGDLARAVGQFRDDLGARYGLRVAIDWPSQPHPLPLVTAITIYRFMQEALLNVVKHSDGDTAQMSLHVTETDVTATVTDAGPGFDLSLVKPERGRHVGLGLLRERARLAGGSVDVASAPGSSTTLTLRLPRSSGGMSILKETTAAVAGAAPQPRHEVRPTDATSALSDV
ncbi:MAG: periplasmic sensor signal transduction histidine kinase [Frankiales bacterium]|nr:periplasmic sensor signal transduction histidine kinase [Frankiales bacterium]